MNRRVLSADLKNIIREPIILIMYLVPCLLIIITVLFLKFGEPMLLKHLDFNLKPYYIYVLAMVLSLTAGMLGAATGFMMIDDRDAKIYELLEITPMGRKGYLINRMLMPVFLTCLYAIMSLIILPFQVTILIGLITILSLSFLMMSFAMVLFFLSDDKVKGLTYAKGLNLIMICALAELTDKPFLIFIAKIFPTYWLTLILRNESMIAIMIGVSVHCLWFALLIFKFLRTEEN